MLVQAGSPAACWDVYTTMATQSHIINQMACKQHLELRCVLPGVPTKTHLFLFIILFRISRIQILYKQVEPSFAYAYACFSGHGSGQGWGRWARFSGGAAVAVPRRAVRGAACTRPHHGAATAAEAALGALTVCGLFVDCLWVRERVNLNIMIITIKITSHLQGVLFVISVEVPKHH